MQLQAHSLIHLWHYNDPLWRLILRRLESRLCITPMNVVLFTVDLLVTFHLLNWYMLFLRNLDRGISKSVLNVVILIVEFRSERHQAKFTLFDFRFTFCHKGALGLCWLSLPRALILKLVVQVALICLWLRVNVHLGLVDWLAGFCGWFYYCKFFYFFNGLIIQRLLQCFKSLLLSYLAVQINLSLLWNYHISRQDWKIFIIIIGVLRILLCCWLLILKRVRVLVTEVAVHFILI